VLLLLFSFHRVKKAGALFTRRALASKAQANVKEMIPGAMIMKQENDRLYILMSLQKKKRGEE